MFSCEPQCIFEAVREQCCCTQRDKAAELFSPLQLKVALRAAFTEPVLCWTLSLTCDSWASVVISQCLSLHD